MNKTELSIVLGSEPPKSPTNANQHSHIPLPKSSNTTKLQDKYQPHQQRRELSERHTVSSIASMFANASSKPIATESAGLGYRMSNSVMAQRASFERCNPSNSSERIEPIYLKPRSKSASGSGGDLKSPEDRIPKVFQSIEGRKTLQCPSGSHSVESTEQKLNRSNSFMENKWKTKYEDSEKRRKMLLQKSETVNREHADLEKKHQQLQKQNNSLQTQIKDKDQQLQKLQTVSGVLCKEYEQLKHQYDIETGALHKAMQQASQWYKQNRELKRRSQVLTQKFLQVNPEGMIDIDISDETDSNSDDVEQLRESVKELSQDVARLQTELNSAKLQEFEAQEQAALYSSQLEEEKVLREEGERRIREFQAQRENMERVTRMVAEEVKSLKAQCDREREEAKMIKMEADKTQRERNVLAHRSSLLLAEVAADPDGRLLAVLQEVESLKCLLEEEKQEYAAQIEMLQERLEEKEASVEFEIVEEKLKLAETELEIVLDRAERAEKAAENLENVVRDLEEKVKELELKNSQPPPPPMPPPPPPPMFRDTNPTIKLLVREKADSERNAAVDDMENILGIAKKPPAVAQQPAIDDIINQIKGGRFTLKQTDKQREEKRKRKQEAEAAPPAVSEMLSILGTMRRRAKPTRQSFKFGDLTM